MDDFEVLQLAIDLATKHGKHNQKAHGRRGAGGGAGDAGGTGGGAGDAGGTGGGAGGDMSVERKKRYRMGSGQEDMSFRMSSLEGDHKWLSDRLADPKMNALVPGMKKRVDGAMREAVREFKRVYKDNTPDEEFPKAREVVERAREIVRAAKNELAAAAAGQED